MDALALLCNLHADGPRTLSRLRGAGCKTLSTLEGLPVRELDELLDGAAKVDRFLGEARLLRSRLGSELLDPEGSGETLLEEPVRDGVESKAIREVAETWRARDAAAPGGPRPVPDEGADVAEPEPADAPHAGRPLEEADIPAIDAATLECLRAAGVSTVEELAAAADMELVKRTGLSFTCVKRIQFLARRAAGPDVVPVTPPRRPEPLRAVRGPVEESAEPSAGGPFA